MNDLTEFRHKIHQTTKDYKFLDTCKRFGNKNLKFQDNIISHDQNAKASTRILHSKNCVDNRTLTFYHFNYHFK